MDLALVVGENPPPGTRQWTLGPFYTPQTAALKVTDNAAGSPQPVMLTATVINPVASFSASRVSFGTEKINSGTARKSVTLTSIGGTARLTFEKHKWTSVSICSKRCRSRGSLRVPGGRLLGRNPKCVDRFRERQRIFQ